MNAIKNFMQKEEGAVAIEYAMLVALLAIAIVSGATLSGRNICGFLNSIGTFLASPNPSAATYAFTACV